MEIVWGCLIMVYLIILHFISSGLKVIVVLRWRTRGIASFRAEELVDEGDEFSDGFVVSVFSRFKTLMERS
ncbi:hypothetical protein OROMI_007494 [Orobanche minor]